MIFECNEEKRAKNYWKHRLDFVDCPSFFEGPVLAAPDERFDYGELRMRALGLLRERVVLVVYTEVEETIRIISMRKALKHEEAYYFESLKS